MVKVDPWNWILDLKGGENIVKIEFDNFGDFKQWISTNAKPTNYEAYFVRKDTDDPGLVVITPTKSTKNLKSVFLEVACLDEQIKIEKLLIGLKIPIYRVASYVWDQERYR